MPFRGYWSDERTFVEEQNFDLSSDIPVLHGDLYFRWQKGFNYCGFEYGLLSHTQRPGEINRIKQEW